MVQRAWLFLFTAEQVARRSWRCTACFVIVLNFQVVVTEELEDERIDIVKDWARYSHARHIKELKEIDTVILAQKAALEELRLADQELYRKALEPDLSLVPFTAKGPCYTPVIPDYLQDGEHQDITKRFAVQYADMDAFMKDISKSTRKRKTKKNEEEED